MVIKFNGDYTKKQTIINALKEYNKGLAENYSADIARNNQYHFEEYYLSNKQFNKIYVEYDNKKHYVIKLQVDILNNTILIEVENYLLQQR